MEIQQRLNEFGLYPGGRLLDGRYGGRTEKGLKKFAQVNNLGIISNQQIDSQFANKLLTVDPTDFRLETARDRASVYQEFLDNQTTNGLFLESVIEKSPFKNDVTHIPQLRAAKKIVHLYYFFLRRFIVDFNNFIKNPV